MVVAVVERSVGAGEEAVMVSVELRWEERAIEPRGEAIVDIFGTRDGGSGRACISLV